jgi:hypothetical protein
MTTQRSARVSCPRRFEGPGGPRRARVRRRVRVFYYFAIITQFKQPTPVHLSHERA